MKARYSFYLSPEATRLLRQASMQNGASRSGIADEAIKAFLSPKPEMSQEPVIVRRLNSHSKTLGDLQRDLAIVTETLGLFVRYFLIVTPPVPESEQEEAKILGRDRFHRSLCGNANSRHRACRIARQHSRSGGHYRSKLTRAECAQQSAEVIRQDVQAHLGADGLQSFA
jgi:hypothetical protein